MKEVILLLDKLGLTGMKTQLSEVMDLANDPQANNIYKTLKKLLTAEYEYKKSRSLNYRLQLARFPTIKLLSDTSQAKLLKNIDIQKVVDNHENILLIGGSGSAKTSLLNQLCKFSHKYLKFYSQILSKNEPWLHSNFGLA